MRTKDVSHVGSASADLGWPQWWAEAHPTAGPTERQIGMNTMKHSIRYLPALILAWLGFLSPPLGAESTYFTDLPLRTMNRAKPNILVAIDNGGYTQRTYSPDTFLTSLNNYRVGGSYVYRDNPAIGTSWAYSNIRIPFYQPGLSGGTNYMDNSLSYGDDDWHYRSNDCPPVLTTVNGVTTQTGSSCPAGQTRFNRLYFHPNYIYTRPVDPNGRTLPTPAEVAADPGSYDWYVTIPQNGGAYKPNASSSPLRGCNADNASIDDNFNDSSYANPGECSTCDNGKRYDLCAWLDGFNPSAGTVNLRNNFTTAPYPARSNQLFPEFLPKYPEKESVRPDGTVETSAFGSYPATVSGTTCTDTTYVAIFCPAGKKPSSPVNGTVYTPNCSLNDSGEPVRAWYWSRCTANNTGGRLSDPITLGNLTELPAGSFPTSSPYYCDLSVFYPGHQGLYPSTANTDLILPCQKAKDLRGATIYANPGPADYFDTDGTRHSLMAFNSGTTKYYIAWNSATIGQFINWYSFYRTRLLALKSSLGLAINGANLNSNFRIGLATVLNGNDANITLGAYSGNASKHYFSAVADFDTNHKQEWYSQLQKLNYSIATTTPDYPSTLHAMYTWFAGTFPNPAVPSGFLDQSAANTGSQYSEYFDSASKRRRSTGHQGPALYSCQANVVAYVTSSVNANWITQRFTNITSSGGACSAPYTGSSFTFTVPQTPCDVDASAVALPSWLSPTNPYVTARAATPGIGYFYDAAACKTIRAKDCGPTATSCTADTGACTGAYVYTDDSTWPAPYKALSGTRYLGYLFNPRREQNSMAQLALYYWAHDLNEEFNRLRPSTPIDINYIPKWDSAGNRLGDRQGVPELQTDKAFWPHVTTYIVNLGSSGTYDYSTSTAANPLTCAGTGSAAGCSGHLDWPALSMDTTTTEYLNTPDDMAHAGATGHGRFLSAYDGTSLKTAFGTLFTDILALAGSQSAVAVANTQVSQIGTSYAFQSSYNTSGWWGDLVASPIQPTTGIISSYTFDAVTCAKPAGSTNAGWSAHCQLRETLCPGYLSSISGCPEGTIPGANHATVRTIITDKGNSSASPSLGQAFILANLSASLFNLYGGDAERVIAYLRGDSTNENCTAGAATGYRCRFQNGTTIGYWNPLGDVVDSEAVVIGPPQTSYADTEYASFKSTQATRAPVVFQGSNDGMLHAFLVDNSRGTRGSENWAYIPSYVQPKLKELARHGYVHQYYVNATPAFGDVDFNNLGAATGSASWHTLLVGGLGKGGRGYYALDVTTPSLTAASSADKATEAAGKVLWVFPHASSDVADVCSNTVANMGYTYGRPAVVKVKSGTAGIRWVVLLASGYDNGSATGGDGKGHLYILDAQTGACLRDIATSDGSSGSAIGLAHIAAQVADPITDQTVKAVYGGDLLGNVWKFGPSSATGGIETWGVTKFAVLKDAAGASQAVTAEPNVALVGGTPLVYIGTGQYLGERDVPTSTNYKTSAGYVGQSIYALADTGSINYAASSARSAITSINTAYRINGDCTDSDGNPTGTCSFGPQYCTVNSPLTRCFSPALQTALASHTTVHPWVFDIPAGERIITSPVLVLGALMFTSNQPISDPCQPGGKSYFYMLDYRTGGAVSGSAFVSQNILDPVTGDNVMASRPTIIQLPDGRVIGLVSTSVGATLQINNILSQPARRTSWREVPNY